MLNKLLGGSHSRFRCVQLLTFMVWLMTMSVNNKVKLLLPFPYINEWILMFKHFVPFTWDKNVFHSKDIILAKAPFHCSPCMSMGKICADQVSQNCFLYSPRSNRKYFVQINRYYRCKLPSQLSQRSTLTVHFMGKSGPAILSYFCPGYV